MNIAILGGGNVGGALGGAWARAGHRIIFGVREPAADKTRRLLEATGQGATACDNAAAAAAGDVVVVATPWNTAVAAVQSAGDLRGKTVIDCTNPLRFVPGTGLQLERGFSDSGAETVARAVPGANVVKAFNTYGWENLADARYPNSAGLKPVMFLAGDEATAKACVISLAEDLGFAPFDAGPLRAARELEPFALLWIRAAMSGPRSPHFAWARLTR